MKKLAVGQDVFLVSSGIYYNVGRVVAVTPSSVDVQTERELIQLDKDGKETDDSRRDRLGFGPSPGDRFHNSLWFSAPEFQTVGDRRHLRRGTRGVESKGRKGPRHLN